MTSRIIFYIILFQFTLTGCIQNDVTITTENFKDYKPYLNNLTKIFPNGGNLFIEEGTYEYDGIVKIPENIQIKGTGKEKVVFKTNNGILISVRDADNILLEGFTILSKSEHSSIRIHSYTKENIPPMENIVLRDIFIDNSSKDSKKSRHGISVKTFGNRNIENITIEDCKVLGAMGSHLSEGFDNCYIASYDAPGIGKIRNVIIRNCHFELSGRQNISLAGDGKSKPDNILVENCKLYNSTLAGIDLEAATNVEILNCDFKKSGTSNDYFIPHKTNSSMRGGIVTHHSSSFIKGCTFSNCKFGHTSINSKNVFEDCAFVNSPISNGHFAEFNHTDFLNCSFQSNSFIGELYRPSATFEGCKFYGDLDYTFKIGGGGKKRLGQRKVVFNSCEFATTKVNKTCFILNYSDIYISNSTMSNYNFLFVPSDHDRVNKLVLDNIKTDKMKGLSPFKKQNSIRDLSHKNISHSLLESTPSKYKK